MNWFVELVRLILVLVGRDLIVADCVLFLVVWRWLLDWHRKLVRLLGVLVRITIDQV